MATIRMPKQQQNPYQGSITKTVRPDGGQQVTMKNQDGSVNFSRDATGNVTQTTTEKVDFDDMFRQQEQAMQQQQQQQQSALPFTSVQPLVAAMDQVYGTKMAGSIPSQGQLIDQQRKLAGREADPMEDLKRQLLEKQIEKYDREDPMKALRMEKLKKEIESIGKQKPLSEIDKVNLELKKAQAAEKAQRKQQIIAKQAEKYSANQTKQGIVDAYNSLQEIERIVSKQKDIPGFGQTGYVPDLLISQDGEDLRASMKGLFNIVLKDRSGAAVTDTELKRLQDEFENKGYKSDVAMRRFLDKYRRRLSEVIRNINAGTPDEVEQAYVQGGGRNYSDDLKNLNFEAGSSKSKKQEIGEEIEKLKRELGSN